VSLVYGNPQEDKWYLFKGVKPPSRQSHGVTEDEIEKVIAKNNEHIHEWRQKGNYIFCTVGEYEHGKNIGVFQRLTGTNKGKPVLVKI
jgi:hypothetical protein